MAKGDIKSFTSAEGGHRRINHARLDATATYDEGDVVAVAAAGDLIEASSEADPGLVRIGVATGNPQSVANTAVGDKLLATAATAGFTNGFIEFTMGDEFITSNITADDDAVLDEIPLESQIGDLCNLRVGSGVWGISVHASGAALNFVVTRVLDAQLEDVGKSGNAGVHAVFARTA